MKNTIQHPVYGPICYEEGFWSGKKTISIGGAVLQKVQKNVYSWFSGEKYEHVTLTGNSLLGVALTIRDEKIWVWSKPAWFDWLLSALPLVLILVWGNSVALCSIIPVAGGAIGGALGGVGLATNIYLMRNKNPGLKILVALLVTLVTFIIGAVLGYMIVYAMLSGNL